MEEFINSFGPIVVAAIVIVAIILGIKKLRRKNTGYSFTGKKNKNSGKDRKNAVGKRGRGFSSRRVNR